MSAAGLVADNAACERESQPECRPVTQAPDSDGDLAQGCRLGQRAAFEELYQRHGPRLRSVALSLMGNVADAEDAVQEAFLKLFRGASSFEGRSAFSTFVHRVVVNTCLDLKRRSRRRREEPAAADDASGAALDRLPGPASCDIPLRVAIERSLSRLSERQRTVFTLFEVQGFQHREIAEMLDISEGTSRSLLFEAKRHLQRLLFGAPRTEES